MGRFFLERIMATATGSVEITPRLMAKAFWDLHAGEQAEFFAELNDVIGDSAYGHGEAQWCAMSIEIEKNRKAKEQACSMFAWVFNRATDFLSRSA
jgi:hypothetical protein